MAAPERLQLQPVAGGELPLHLQRALWLIVDEHWPDDVDHDDVDVIALGEAVARFAFEHQLLYIPATESLAAEGLRFYPVTPHQVKPVWLCAPAPAPAAAPARRPTLRELGAQRIDSEPRA